MRKSFVPRSYLLATVLLVAVTMFPSGAIAASPETPNPLQVAILRWYPANTAGLQFAVGTSPIGVAFDGANIWVANSGSSTVTKLQANTGAVVGTFQVGAGPVGVAFDGANIWVANFDDSTVTKLRASTGAVLGTFRAGRILLGSSLTGPTFGSPTTAATR